MSFNVAVWRRDEVWLAADSRLTLRDGAIADGGREYTADVDQKLVWLEHPAVGVAYAGRAAVKGRLMSDLLACFAEKHGERIVTTSDALLALCHFITAESGCEIGEIPGLSLIAVGLCADRAQVCRVTRGRLDTVCSARGLLASRYRVSDLFLKAGARLSLPPSAVLGRYVANHLRDRSCGGEIDVVRVSPAASGWVSRKQSRKRCRTVAEWLTAAANGTFELRPCGDRADRREGRRWNS